MARRSCGHNTKSGCRSCRCCFACCKENKDKLNAALTRAVDLTGMSVSYEEAIRALRQQIRFLERDRKANFGGK